MRTASICPTCANFYNAACIVYNGDFLSNIQVNPLDTLDIIIEKINNNLVPLSGIGAPSSVPNYIGQLYLDTATNTLYIGLSILAVNWGIVDVISTTSTTTTHS